MEDLIFSYTVKNAVDDETFFPANDGRMGELSRQFYKHPCFYSVGVRRLMRGAIDNPRSGASLEGVWGDVLHMSRHSPDRREVNAATISFSVIIWAHPSRSVESKRNLHRFEACVQAYDVRDPAPVVTFYLPAER